MAADSGTSHPFAPPHRGAEAERSRVSATLRFAVRRGLRLVVTVTVIVAWAVLVLRLGTWSELSLALAVGVAVWLPTSIVQGRVVFFPSPPDAWLSHDGSEPVSDRDIRAWIRSEVLEEVVSSVMPLSLVAWVLGRSHALPWSALLLGTCALAVLLLGHTGHRVTGVVVQEATLDLAAGREPRNERALELLAALRVFGHRTTLAYLVARARFRRGDLAGALSALDGLGDAWAEPLRVQMTLTRDGSGPARALAAELHAAHDRAPIADVLLALADLHDGHPEAVVAASERIRALPPSEMRRFGLVLLAAAHGADDPREAHRALAGAGWDVHQAQAALAPWPTIVERLSALG